MHGNARCGHVLNVELPYLSNNHFFILGIFSGIGSNGNEVGRSGTVDLWGHLHEPSSGAPHPLFIDLIYLWGREDTSTLGLPPAPIVGKSLFMIRRSTIVSYDI